MYITHILNLSLTAGVVPITWKTAYVRLLHKPGCKDNLNNYRSVSKLSQLKLFWSWSSLLSPFQSGFRVHHSTISAASLLVNDITTALERKQHSAALFVDLPKAYDAVDHKWSFTGFDHASVWMWGTYSQGLWKLKRVYPRARYLGLCSSRSI